MTDIDTGKTKAFQVMSDGKIKQLTPDEYYSRLNREGYHVGYIDKKRILFASPIYLTRKQLNQILDLADVSVQRNEAEKK